MAEVEIEIKTGGESEKEMEGKKICYSSINKAENGYVVNWSERSSKKSNSMEHVPYQDRSKVFTMEQKEEAWSLFRSLKEMEMDQGESY